jgi:hypothetical protein
MTCMYGTFLPIRFCPYLRYDAVIDTATSTRSVFVKYCATVAWTVSGKLVRLSLLFRVASMHDGGGATVQVYIDYMIR